MKGKKQTRSLEQIIASMLRDYMRARRSDPSRSKRSRDRQLEKRAIAKELP